MRVRLWRASRASRYVATWFAFIETPLRAPTANAIAERWVRSVRDVLGLWVGDGGEGAKYWHQVLSEIRNRGVNDVLFLVYDGLRGLVESVSDILVAGDRADLRAALGAQHLPLCEQAVLA